MTVLHHLHRELLKDVVNLIQSSPSTVTFYKVKSHSGITGNEGADHLEHKAAVNQISDVSLPPATDPFLRPVLAKRSKQSWLPCSRTSTGFD